MRITENKMPALTAIGKLLALSASVLAPALSPLADRWRRGAHGVRFNAKESIRKCSAHGLRRGRSVDTLRT
jgi:hypothetical protein